MSSTPTDADARFRKNIEDAAVFGTAIALSVGAVVQFGPLGLAAACVLLSLAAAVVVGREAYTGADEHAVGTDGGHDGD